MKVCRFVILLAIFGIGTILSNAQLPDLTRHTMTPIEQTSLIRRYECTHPDSGVTEYLVSSTAGQLEFDKRLNILQQCMGHMLAQRAGISVLPTTFIGPEIEIPGKPKNEYGFMQDRRRLPPLHKSPIDLTDGSSSLALAERLAKDTQLSRILAFCIAFRHATMRPNSLLYNPEHPERWFVTNFHLLSGNFRNAPGHAIAVGLARLLYNQNYRRYDVYHTYTVPSSGPLLRDLALFLFKPFSIIAPLFTESTISNVLDAAIDTVNIPNAACQDCELNTKVKDWVLERVRAHEEDCRLFMRFLQEAAALVNPTYVAPAPDTFRQMHATEHLHPVVAYKSSCSSIPSQVIKELTPSPERETPTELIFLELIAGAHLCKAVGIQTPPLNVIPYDIELFQRKEPNTLAVSMPHISHTLHGIETAYTFDVQRALEAIRQHGLEDIVAFSLLVRFCDHKASNILKALKGEWVLIDLESIFRMRGPFDALFIRGLLEFYAHREAQFAPLWKENVYIPECLMPQAPINASNAPGKEAMRRPKLKTKDLLNTVDKETIRALAQTLLPSFERMLPIIEHTDIAEPLQAAIDRTRTTSIDWSSRNTIMQSRLEVISNARLLLKLMQRARQE